MSNDWQQWPGLDGADAGRLTVQRAAFGKADRARTGYRWLAASVGWVADAQLERRLALGGEDRSVRCPLWRHEFGQWLAVMCVPSRARDFEGRPTPLEKHILSSLEVHGVTPALAAFTLFESVLRMDSDMWFDSYDQPQWQRADYQLQLDASAAPALDVQLDCLKGRVEEGLALLREATTQGDLAQFYAELRTPGAPPALLRLKSEMPLEPIALAALLLPLEPREYSLAGGIPSSIFPAEDEVRHWNGLVVQTHVQRVPARTDVAETERRRGEEMAAALWESNPARLSRIHPAVGTSAAPADATAPRTAATVRVHGPSTETSGDGTIQELVRGVQARNTFLSFVRSQRYEIAPAELSESERWSHRNFAEWQEVVNEFKTKVLGPLDDLELKPAPDDRYERLAWQSHRDVLRKKAEVGRAWLIALLPKKALLADIESPDSHDVGPLSFAVHFDAKRWKECCDLDQETIDDFILRSKRGTETTRLVDQWTQDAGLTR